MKNINRRKFLTLTGTSIIGLTFGGTALRVSAQEKLSLDDPSAKALKYVHESPDEGKLCSNCSYIQGEVGAEWRPCPLFPNKLVNNKGWCAAWVKKAA
jgi:hypothetical protein